MSFNRVTYMVKGVYKFEFVAINPSIIKWLDDNGYKPYLDDYSDMDCIFARSKSEYESIRLYMTRNP